MKPFRILVTDGEQRSSLAIVRSLGAAGHFVAVTSTTGRSLTGASRYSREDFSVPDALEEPEGFGEAVIGLVERNSIDVVFPVTEASLRVLLPQRSRLPGVLVPSPDYETFSRVSDKNFILAAASRLGIAVPEQVVLENRDSAACLEFDYPLVLKPCVSVVRERGRSHKLRVLHASDRRQLDEALGTLPDAAFPVLAQRRIVGPGVGIFLLIWDGITKAVFAHRRIREKPPSGGVSTYRESIEVPAEWVAQAERLLNSVGWSGVAMVEFKVDQESSRPYLMEINGRFWGSLQLAVDAGVDFPLLLLAAATGEELPDPPKPLSGIRLRWELGDADHLLARLFKPAAVLNLPEECPSRLATLLDIVLAWRPGDRWEVFRPSDPRPFLRELRLWLQGR